MAKPHTNLHCINWYTANVNFPGNHNLILIMLSLSRPSHHPRSLLHYITTTYSLNLVQVFEDTRLSFTATQCLRSPSQIFIPGIPFKLLNHMTLPPYTLQFTITHTSPALFFLFLLTIGFHPSFSSLTYLMPTFPFLTLTATSPHSANLTSLLVSLEVLKEGINFTNSHHMTWMHFTIVSYR